MKNKIAITIIAINLIVIFIMYVVTLCGVTVWNQTDFIAFGLLALADGLVAYLLSKEKDDEKDTPPTR